MKRTGSTRRNTRKKFRGNKKTRGKVTIRNYLKIFKPGDMAVLRAEPSYQKGLYHPRFHGRNGRIIGKKGRCYEILIKDRTKEKVFIVHPVHLKKV